MRIDYAKEELRVQSKNIDFVVTWVDESDKSWIKQRKEYECYNSGDNREERYRDLGLFKYWFRSIESFAPWINKIHFVTWGHVPSWLNTEHPKIHVVNHNDYIPSEYLPTFNSNVLDLNLHRIDGLAECFVFFNDDTFLLNDAQPKDFFIGGLPRASAVLSPMRVVKGTDFYTPFANISILNNHFSLRDCVRKNPFSWINPKYGIDNVRTLLMLPYPYFYGFKENHLPNAFLRSTFEQVWELEHDTLDVTCKNKFRGATDVSQWLMRQWQIASGCFVPQESAIGRNFELARNFDETLTEACVAIKNKAYLMMCVSDGGLAKEDFLVAKDVLNNFFDELLPQKSEYEL